MSITITIFQRYQQSFQLYRDLVNEIDEAALQSKLPNLPSNTIGQQLWCVVGARESYRRAIAANAWAGFACSLTVEQITRKADLLDALATSEALINEQLAGIDTFSDMQNDLLLKLLEHECVHHGQLIRYLYGLKLPIPQSWRDRYAL